MTPLINLEFFNDIIHILQQGMSTKNTFQSIFNLIEKAIPFDSATLFLYREKQDSLEIMHQKGDHPADLAGQIPFERGSGIASWVSKQHKPIILESLSKSRAGKENLFSSFVALPLWAGDRLIGVLNLGHHQSSTYKRELSEEYAMLASQISIVLEQIILRSEMELQNKELNAALNSLQKTQNELVEKERLAAIGELVVTVNHEINNPLTTIIGLSEILELTYARADEEKVREGLQGIIKEAKRIQKVTEKLSRIQSTHSRDYLDGTKMLKL